MTLPKAKSITHQHLLSVINTLLIRSRANQETVHILDAGCGNGHFIYYLHRGLQVLHPGKLFVIHGFDVSDHGVQSDGFLSDAMKNLTILDPDIDWSQRIYSLNQGQSWDFNEQKYDFIVSNQVLEHVRDKDSFFFNVGKKLTDGGYSVHLAPLRSVFPEDHVHIPFAHRFTNFGAMHGFIRMMSALGIGKFREANKSTGIDLETYSERHADYLYHWTAYSSESETLMYARRHFMRADFRFSFEFYTAKLAQLFGVRARTCYRFRSWGFFDAVMVKVLRYLSSVTLVTEKKNTY
jgi:SAM-dependent methyltransferase